jgi:CYTH domain-containing protein
MSEDVSGARERRFLVDLAKLPFELRNVPSYEMKQHYLLNSSRVAYRLYQNGEGLLLSVMAEDETLPDIAIPKEDIGTFKALFVNGQFAENGQLDLPLYATIRLRTICNAVREVKHELAIRTGVEGAAHELKTYLSPIDAHNLVETLSDHYIAKRRYILERGNGLDIALDIPEQGTDAGIGVAEIMCADGDERLPEWFDEEITWPEEPINPRQWGYHPVGDPRGGPA